MFYFIPSWYPDTEPWYRSIKGTDYHRGQVSFDDMINQMRLFSSTDSDREAVILNYAPQLRYHLHRYDLLETTYWSVFDSIQGITTHVPSTLDFLDLQWPEDVDFVYSPFIVFARRGGQLYATISFGDEGNMTEVVVFGLKYAERQYLFDDRGFLSSITYHGEDGVARYRDYLNDIGQWRIREHLINHCQVEVNSQFATEFEKESYPNMEELIAEKLASYWRYPGSENDVLILAADQRHNQLVFESKNEQKILLSYFDRRQLPPSDELQYQLNQANGAITHTKAMQELLSENGRCPIETISLFDTRLSLGKSQRMKELKIYFLIDSLKVEEREEVLDCLFDQMRQIEDAYLEVVTYNQDLTLKTWLEGYLQEQPEEFLRFKPDKDAKTPPAPIVEEGLGKNDVEEIEPRVEWLYLDTELKMMSQLEWSRIIIDLGEEPDPYTQIAGISAGIPQINRSQTEFVEHLKNGYLISTTSDLAVALQYYLCGLKNWNQSLVYSVQKIAEYTSGEIIERITTLLDE